MTQQEQAQDRLNAAVALVRRFVPKYRLIRKSGSRLHRLIGRLLALVGNRDYMQHVFTTVGFTTAVPADMDAGPGLNDWSVVLHEGRHGFDAKKLTRPLFYFIYLCPQLLGVLGCLAAVVGWAITKDQTWLWGLLSVVLVAPWPSPRALLERRAYRTEMAADFWSGRMAAVGLDAYRDSIIRSFTGGEYDHMSWSSRWVRKWVTDWYWALHTNWFKNSEQSAYLDACYELAARVKSGEL